jgi:hypothetical protein
MSALPVLPIELEWRFDPSYPDADKDALTEWLGSLTFSWVEEVLPSLANEFRRNPKRKFAAAIQGAGSSLQVNGAPVHVLLILALNIGQLPLCLVYAGPEAYIRAKASQAQEQYTQEALAIPGNEATIVDRREQ